MSKCDWMTADDVKQSYESGISGCGVAFQSGVQTPRQNPMEGAIAAINAGIWEKNTRAGVDKWAKKLSSITLEQWKSAAVASAAMYAEQAVGKGSVNYEKYFNKAKSIIEAAAAKFVKSQKTDADLIAFWQDMGKLKGL